jgi:nucleoside-diphosphate-sugar epimerase
MKVFVFGLGYSAEKFAQLGLSRQRIASIEGSNRALNASKLRTESGVVQHAFNGREKGETIGDALARTSHVVISIPPDEMGDPVLRLHREELDAAEGLEWLCYYSTVGVYGDFAGAWIDEKAPLVPRNARSDRRVAAEAEWRDYATARGVPLTILRLAGIYGPGRSAFDKLAEGTAHRIVKPGQVFNRIHVDDIARVTLAAAEAKLDGIFNLSDDEPAPPQDVVTYAAQLMGVEPPPEEDFATAEMSAMARSFYADNKKVSNRAIKQALGTELAYPDYRAGLRGIWESQG